jgi:hypothetical protein
MYSCWVTTAPLSQLGRRLGGQLAASNQLAVARHLGHHPTAGSTTRDNPRQFRQLCKLHSLQRLQAINKGFGNYPDYGGPGREHRFGFQLNAYSPRYMTSAWQQYALIVSGTNIQGQINNWPVTGPWLINQLDALQSLPNSNTMPAGCWLTFNLETDADNNVTTVVFGIEGTPIPGNAILQTLTSISGVTQADLAPIVAFELDLVGPNSSQHTQLSSGAGKIIYSASAPLKTLSVLPRSPMER